jgi:hypothetical protein
MHIIINLNYSIQINYFLLFFISYLAMNSLILSFNDNNFAYVFYIDEIYFVIFCIY